MVPVCVMLPLPSCIHGIGSLVHCHVLIGSLSHVSCLSLVGSCHVTCIVCYK